MTANELLVIARKGRPEVTYATNDKKTVIGAWNETEKRYIPVAGLLLTGKWASLPYELLINGKRQQYNWIN